MSRAIPASVAAGILLISVLLDGAAAQTQTQTQRYTVGVDGPGWRELATRWVALDDTTVPGAIQPKELRPWENVMVGPGETNIFGFQWHTVKTGLKALGRELGINPRVWAGHFLSDPAIQLLDGDPTTAFQVLKVVPQEEFNLHGSLTGSAFSDGFRQDWRETWTFDLALTLPIERIRFFPRQSGIDADGVPNKRRAPQGFELSVTAEPHEFLLLGSEPISQQSPLAPLDNVILRTLLNSASIVEVTLEPQPVRFIRLNLGILRQSYSMAEFEVYGRGVPPSVEYVTRAIDMGRPVNFGRVVYDLVKWRRDVNDELVQDPKAPVSLGLQTRTGRDDSPQTYWLIDEVGRDVQVTREEYDDGDAPKTCCLDLRLPGMKSAITEDTEEWTPWSSPYERSGQSNRSADGRQWLQFRFSMTTEDPLAFAQLRSLSFEFSSLLALEVVGEVGLVEAPDLEVITVPAGELQRFALDLQATFGADEGGFDAVRLGVPPGARYVGLEMAEIEVRNFVPVVADSLAELPGEITVFFPSNRIDADNNRLVRVLFDAAIYSSTTVFTGEVIDVRSGDFPQSVDAGNANGDVASDALKVFASQQTLPIVSGLEVVPPVMTPNDDGRNDTVTIGFQLMGIEGAAVHLEILDLSGRQVARIDAGILGQGVHSVPWDGRDGAGTVVPPGIYIGRLSIDTQTGGGDRLLTVPVVY